MTRFLVVLVPFMVATLALAQPTPSSPHKPRIDGSIHAVSAADIRTVLALMPAHFREHHFRPVPIDRIHVIDRNTMTVHFWPDSFTYARRIKGHWRIDYADTERVKVDGFYIPG